MMSECKEMIYGRLVIESPNFNVALIKAAAEIEQLQARIAELEAEMELRPITEIPEINKTILLKKSCGEYITGKLISTDDVDNNSIPKFVIFETSTTVFYASRDEIIGWKPIPEPPEVKE